MEGGADNREGLVKERVDKGEDLGKDAEVGLEGRWGFFKGKSVVELKKRRARK